MLYLCSGDHIGRLIDLDGALPSLVTEVPLDVIKQRVTLSADGNEVMLNVFATKPEVGQMVNAGGRLFTYDTFAAINRQSLLALGLPCCGFDICVVVHMTSKRQRPATESLAKDLPTACAVVSVADRCRQVFKANKKPLAQLVFGETLTRGSIAQDRQRNKRCA